MSSLSQRHLLGIKNITAKDIELILKLLTILRK